MLRLVHRIVQLVSKSRSSNIISLWGTAEAKMKESILVIDVASVNMEER